jgi:hypothetical protein
MACGHDFRRDIRTAYACIAIHLLSPSPPSASTVAVFLQLGISAQFFKNFTLAGCPETDFWEAF